MEKKQNIGLALSGGGIRAAIFHAGVLKYLAEVEMLEQVSYISTVSGASLLMGLVYTISGNRFPTSKQYMEDVFPEIEDLLTTKDLQSIAIRKLFCNPSDWLNRGNLLAKLLKSFWGINGSLQDVFDYPIWVINGTTRETGKCWRYSKKRMGDYKTGYVIEPIFPIADAIASSAAFPPYIDHYKLHTSLYEWMTYEKKTEYKNNSQPTNKIEPMMEFYHITDGGIYDNLGTEAVFKIFGETLRKEIDYLIVSDAGSTLDIKDVGLLFHKKVLGNIDIIYSQINNLRLRIIFNFFNKNINTGVIVKIGRTVNQLLIESEKITNKNKNKININIDEYLSDDQVYRASNYPTDLKIATNDNFNLIARHGYENTKVQLSLYL